MIAVIAQRGSLANSANAGSFGRQFRLVSSRQAVRSRFFTSYNCDRSEMKDRRQRGHADATIMYATQRCGRACVSQVHAQTNSFIPHPAACLTTEAKTHSLVLRTRVPHTNPVATSFVSSFDGRSQQQKFQSHCACQCVAGRACVRLGILDEVRMRRGKICITPLL